VQADIPPEQRGIGDGARTQQRVDRPDPVGAAIKRRGTPERGNASKRVVRVDAKPVALPCQNGELAQAAINQHQIVIAAEIAVVSPDFGHLAPMGAAARRELEAIGIRELPKVVNVSSTTANFGASAGASIGPCGGTPDQAWDVNSVKVDAPGRQPRPAASSTCATRLRSHSHHGRAGAPLANATAA
jgi:hypothetical protein